MFDNDYDMYKIADLNKISFWWYILFVYLPPLILLQGVIGNVFSLMVFIKLGKLKNKIKPDLLIQLGKHLISKFYT